jgi:hypothetical protein
MAAAIDPTYHADPVLQDIPHYQTLKQNTNTSWMCFHSYISDLFFACLPANTLRPNIQIKLFQFVQPENARKPTCNLLLERCAWRARWIPFYLFVYLFSAAFTGTVAGPSSFGCSIFIHLGNCPLSAFKQNWAFFVSNRSFRVSVCSRRRMRNDASWNASIGLDRLYVRMFRSMM